ncbi:unnamed protein product [Miscanthus lutarioriparius]|uniref:Uncharacterized protein n=1 Tax=Miscanthus lutarioriparius TaxID=422564 RepID=A0A811Q5A4_9POAL|nr:unnamed protein product [Miscanthus lutarioriparius]
MSFSRPRRGRDDEEQDAVRVGDEGSTPAKRPRSQCCSCSCCSHHQVLSPLSEIRTHQLKFENKCCNDKYSRHDIMADDGTPIKVAIYDKENRVITNGPLSSIQVKIVVLDGEFNKENKEQWNENSFKTSIVHCRPGKQPLFANELYLRLENGVAPLCGVKFQDNSSFVPSKKFKLGAMADDDNISEKILEGISESFAVKDGHGYHHDWNIIVGHALSCKPGPERYSYRIPGTDTTFFFTSLYQIVGAEFSGKYTSYEELNNTQKGIVQGSKAIAYDNLKHEVITGESRRPRQRWVKVVTMVNTMVTTLHIWSKKSEPPCPQGTLDFGMTDVSMDSFWEDVDSEYPIPLAQTTSFEMTDILTVLKTYSESVGGARNKFRDDRVASVNIMLWDYCIEALAQQVISLF